MRVIFIYTAHYRISDKARQSVKDHSINVSKYCNHYGEPIGIAKLSELIGLLHDMGKYGDEFQEYIENIILNEENIAYDARKKTVKKVDHGKIGAMYIYSKYHNMDNSAKITAEIIAMAICYHHGGLNDYITFNCEIPLLNRFGNIDQDYIYKQATGRFFEQVYDENYVSGLFTDACKEIDNMYRAIVQKALPITFSIHLLIKQVYSMLIDADRYDTYLFMDNKRDKPSIGTKELWEQYSALMDRKVSEFRNTIAKSSLQEKINRLRLEVSDACEDFSDRDTGVYTLTVPTGGGKTLSSLRFALRHAYVKDKKRIIYILPFTTIIEQNAQEIRDVLKCDVYMLEHHSNIIHNISDNTEDSYKLLTQRWDSPIIITTMVQFLDTIYAGGTQAIRRMHNLSDSILIFDEIQTIPIKCISLFNNAINYLSVICNTTVILCSATQPNLSQTKIPLLKSSNGEIIPDITDKFRDFKRMEVKDHRISGGYSYETLGDFIYQLKINLSSVLIVVNTKNCAERTYKELKRRNKNKGNYIFYLSTNLCPAHRKKVIRVMKKCLDRRKSVICVSTQLIEAGINISFEGIVRHLAGLDSIAQATGRGNRHGEGDIKVSYIINLADEKLGSLKEIELGELHTAEILDDYRKNAAKFNNDLLSPEAIKRYYDYYYSDKAIEESMNYPVKIKDNSAIRNTDIYKMLSGAVPNKRSYEDRFGEKCELQLNYMFETAGKYFKVIDDLTTTVLVPYGKGKEIITGLFSSKAIEKKLEYLKQVQQYSVNIYDNQKDSLMSQNAFEASEIPGIYVLKDGYYDKTLGVISEKQMEFLSI